MAGDGKEEKKEILREREREREREIVCVWLARRVSNRGQLSMKGGDLGSF
jgi:hypothetical protein